MALNFFSAHSDLDLAFFSFFFVHCARIMRSIVTKFNMVKVQGKGNQLMTLDFSRSK